MGQKYTTTQSFLHQTLLLADSHESRVAILRIVDWNNFDSYRLGSAAVAVGMQRAYMQHQHPLTTVALLNDPALFNEALAQADASSQDPIYIDHKNSHVSMSDWVKSGALTQIFALGSLDICKSFVNTLLKRLPLTSSIQVNNDDAQNPWKSLARHNAHENARSLAGKIKLLDQFARAKHRNQFGAASSTLSADGTGRLNATDKRVRQGIHANSLLWAAKEGNMAMVDALLDMDHHTIYMSTVQKSIHGGHYDIARKLLSHPRGEADLSQRKTIANDTAISSGIVFMPTLSFGSIQNSLSSLGYQVKTNLDHAKRHQNSVSDVCMSLLRLTQCFSAAQIKDRAKDMPGGEHGTYDAEMFPALLMLGEEDADKALSIVLSRHPDGALGALPGVFEIGQALEQVPESPWLEKTLQRIGTLGPDNLAAYLKKLGESLQRGLTSNTPMPLVEYAALKHIWSRLEDKSPRSLPMWIEDQIDRMFLTPEAKAEIEKRLLNQQSPVLSHSKRTPRL